MPTSTIASEAHPLSHRKSHINIMLNMTPCVITKDVDSSLPPAPPDSPMITDLPLPPSELASPTIKILQLNCFNTQPVLHEILSLDNIDILLLQEPWINTYTHRVPTHTEWHAILPYDYTPDNLQTKFRTCIYIRKTFKTDDISILPSKSPYITAAEIKTHDPHIRTLRVVSFYNRPTTNEGIPVLQDWLNLHSSRTVPTIIGMDGNLHHPHWNPTYRTNTHPMARELVRMMGTTGHKLLSEKGVPTFYPRQRGKPSTIDLTWGNWKLSKLNHTCLTLKETFGSDHQGLLITLPREPAPRPPTRNTASLKNLKPVDYCNAVENQLSAFSNPNDTETQIMANINQLTTILLDAFHKQGKDVPDDKYRRKAWWDETKLRPLIRTRNRARRWMIRSNLPEAKECYWNWQRYVKSEIEKLKRKHWRCFLAKADNALAFKAMAYTVPTSSGSVAPLYRADKSIATDKTEQAELLFYGTSVALTDCNLSDISTESPPPIGPFPAITEHEVEEIIKDLPNKKAKGDDDVPNELIKLAKSLLSPALTQIFNQCLKLSFYPQCWKRAITAIIRKHDKADYSEPNAYRPIALLSCLSKVFEALLTRRLSYWAETNCILAEGHNGGRRQHSTEDAFVTLTTWIKHKWRLGMIVSGLFLDVKSAYPSVHHKRLIDTLRKKECPEYLVRLIQQFLTDRTTSLRLENFNSQDFMMENGLPQGSPISVMLYLIYNSNLLIDKPISLTSQRISIGFLDDITHLVANADVEQNIVDLEAEGRRSLRWGVTHGAIFDKRKAQLMHFTHRKHSNPSLTLGDQTIVASTELRWLGLWLDPKLSFNTHISKMHHRGKATIAQIHRLSRCFWGLSPRETRLLITAILKPRILFGSIVWLTTKTKKKVKKIFDTLQNAANRLILGAFRSSPTTLLRHDANTLSFIDLATRAHHFFIYNRLTAASHHPTRKLLEHSLHTSPTKHPDPIHQLIGRSHLTLRDGSQLETIHPYPSAPWIQPYAVIENLGLPKDEAVQVVKAQVDDETDLGSLIIFTDGSFVPEIGGGAAIASNDIVESKSFGPPEGISNYEMEAMALSIALNHYIDRIETDTTPRNNTLALFSDSQAALHLLNNPPQYASLQYFGTHLQELLTHITRRHTIKFFWTPGHKGIALNEKADKAAGEAAEATTNRFVLPFSLASTKQHVRATFNNRQLTPQRGSYRTRGKFIAEALDKLEKGQAAAIFQLRSGHSPLNSYLARIQAAPDDKCPHCRRKETTTHYLLYCPKYTQERRRFRNALKEAEIKADTRRAEKILDNPLLFPYLADYIVSTNRFEHLRRYVEQEDQPRTRTRA